MAREYAFQLLALDRQVYGSRHDHMVRRFSQRADLIIRLRARGVERGDAILLIEHTCEALSVPAPAVTFHGRRGPFTGYCQMPRAQAVARTSEQEVSDWERQKNRAWPRRGMIRLGDPTSLGTISHELGHHLVNHLEGSNTPSHGKAWVGWFDIAAARVGERLGIRDEPNAVHPTP